jgi:hypothetical protein
MVSVILTRWNPAYIDFQLVLALLSCTFEPHHPSIHQIQDPFRGGSRPGLNIHLGIERDSMSESPQLFDSAASTRNQQSQNDSHSVAIQGQLQLVHSIV